MNPEEFFNVVRERFQEHSWRMTAGVGNVTRVLAETQCPLSPADIINELDKDEKSIDLATAYRILDRLEEIGMAKRVIGKYMPTADPFNRDEIEHFLVCERTGKAESIFLNYHQAIADQLKKEKNFTLLRTDITFFGTKDYDRPE